MLKHKRIPMAITIAVLILILSATACSTHYPAETGSSTVNGPQSEAASFMPIYFDSEEQLLSTINEVKIKTSKTGAEDNTVIINANMTGKQTYSAKIDMFNLASITEFYKSQEMLRGTSLKQIVVKNEYIGYDYVNKDQIVCANFTWFREMSPEVHMNELYGRGEISDREIEYNGIKYVFREWADPKTQKSAGFTINWVAGGKSYSASVPTGYTDDEMLKFCQFEAVIVK